MKHTTRLAAALPATALLAATFLAGCHKDNDQADSSAQPPASSAPAAAPAPSGPSGPAGR